MKHFIPGYAIVRIDEFIASPEPGTVTEPQNCSWNTKVRIKKIVPSVEIAISEIERLNKVNEDKNCIYFWQYTRLEGFDTFTEIEHNGTGQQT
jgi:hypothetical protein